MTDSDVSRLTADPEEMRIFQQERLVVEITELMCKAMKERGIRRGQLADQLDKSKGRISQILNGETNLTLRTVADVFTALGKTLTVSAEDIYVERAPLQCVGQIVAVPPVAWQLPDWRVEEFAHGPCSNLNMAG